MIHRLGIWLGTIFFLAAALASTLACANSLNEAPSQGDGSDNVLRSSRPGRFYFGQASLEERIAGANVIARVTLDSVTTGTERWNDPEWATYTGDGYVGTLEHTFTVHEYLKGTGDDEIVALAYELGDESGRDTLAKAAEDANALLAARDTQWDGREAIVFLNADHQYMPDLPRAGRYVLGVHPEIRGSFTTAERIYGDYYTIASIQEKVWLPVATGALGASARSATTKRFLLDVPSGSEGASGQATSGQARSREANTITLAQLKTKVNGIEQDAVAGGGSEAYRDCLYWKYREARGVSKRNESRGGEPYYKRWDETMDSGLPVGSEAYAIPTVDSVSHAYESDYAEYELTGRDADLFFGEFPGYARNIRPLPEGEYKFYFNIEYAFFVPCDGQPEEQKTAHEVFVTVTAPEGTVHEALFDPVSSEDAVGHHGTGDALSATDFTLADGTEISIESLVHDSERLTLGLSTFNALTGHTLDFITVDGTSALTLNASAAAVNAEYGTLTWAVSDQPWTSVDKLMLRISEPEPLRAEFRRAPHSHNGRTAFTIRLRFNAPVAGLDATTVQSALEVENGRITRARTVNPDQTHLWELRVQPARGGLLTITLPSSKNCTSTPVICDGGERPVSEAVILRVQGSVRDE